MAELESDIPEGELTSEIQEGIFEVDEVDEVEAVEVSEEIDQVHQVNDQSDDAISEDELDTIADTAIAALEDILKYFNVGEVEIDEYEGDEGELILDITGSDLAVLIGRHGRTLDALQFLISAITSRKIGYRYPVVVDVEGYKNRQREKIESLALSAAKRALSQSRAIKMRPMSPYERRLVHMALRDFEGIQTGSEGEGSSRHVVIEPVD